MDSKIRQQYNAEFTTAKYEAMLQDIHSEFPDQLEFRVAETPVFVPKALKEKLFEACESIIDVIGSADFKEKTINAIPVGQEVPNENAHTSFLAIDFAVCKDENDELIPQLIELQGFPSVFGFQYYVSQKYREHFNIPDTYQNIFGGAGMDYYVNELKRLLLGEEKPENVILLEIYPEIQKTRIDFVVTEKLTGVKPVCYTKIKKEGRKLYYDLNGEKTEIKRIYHRLIFDDLSNFPDLKTDFQITDDVDVTWVGHPNWFFRISKYSMPYLSSPYIPETKFLSAFEGRFPEDLENYVLKPLFSFAGSGVNLHVKLEDLTTIDDPENYILQRKVKYEPVIQALDGLIKCEIRMLYIWHENEPRPKLLTNLSRLSRGEMIGVRFNKNFDWVGGSTCFMES